MIKYRGGAFGFQVLLRMHGSAMFKATLPSLFSTGFYVLFFSLFDLEDPENRIFDHPYPMGALIAAFTFLLSFKTSFSYGRYWEATTVVYQMQSKWLDVGMELAAFHLQSNRYTHPPAFGEYPEATAVKRLRERTKEPTRQELEEQIDSMTVSDKTILDRINIFKKKKNSTASTLQRRRQGKTQSINAPIAPYGKTTKVENNKAKVDNKSSNAATPPKRVSATSSNIPSTVHSTTNSSSLLGANGTLSKEKFPRPPSSIASNSSFDSRRSQFRLSRKSSKKSIIRSLVNEVEFHPSLFLQEGAHLISLLSAVALSTLRNDVEEAPSPICTFEANAPWPPLDPDDLDRDFRKDWASSHHRAWVVVGYLLGKTRTAKSRTLYNAARPLRVIGGVSDAEIAQLQKARGPLAKVALCTMWLQEFIAREHLHGSTGPVGPPIISRLFQYTSDGMIGYNQARKIAYIPFPFPHAQITSLYVIVMVIFIPILMLSYVNNETFGAILTFFTVLCFTGLYEVSRELENPFKNVPNDLPLNNFQAQFNEALLQMYNGYHPDAWWVVEEAPLPPLISTGLLPEEEEEAVSLLDASMESLPKMEDSDANDEMPRHDESLPKLLEHEEEELLEDDDDNNDVMLLGVTQKPKSSGNEMVLAATENTDDKHEISQKLHDANLNEEEGDKTQGVDVRAANSSSVYLSGAKSLFHGSYAEM